MHIKKQGHQSSISIVSSSHNLKAQFSFYKYMNVQVDKMKYTGRITGSSSLIMIKQHLTKHSNQVSCVHFICDLILIDKYLQLLMICTPV